MIIDSPETKRSQNQSSDVEENDHLQLNPGPSERKPRSVGNFYIWLTFILVGVVGSTAAYFVISNFIYNIQHPHSDMYYKPSNGEELDLSTVVQPMIKEGDAFNIVASVWIRDDEGKDGGFFVDGEERPERLIFSDTVFRNIHMKSKNFKNVTLRIPTSHFKRMNISNYDLRASFVLVQPNRPSWLDRAQNFVSWKPDNFHSPKLRVLGHEPTLEDEIYDSFGFTIPLIRFHEVSSSKTNKPITIEVPETGVDEDEKDDEDDILDEADLGHKGPPEVMDVFPLQFTGDKEPVTKRHPFIVGRTHLGIIDETNIYKRAPYIRSQKDLAEMACRGIPNPTWYQCARLIFLNGVFETRVQISAQSENQASKKDKSKQYEYLYAPYLHAVGRSPGPKDLFAVPVDREAISLNIKEETTGPEYVNVTWRLSFQTHKPGREFFHLWSSPPTDFNMTATEEELTYIQHQHDSALGFAGYRIHENAHPRRGYLITFVSRFIRVLCWFLTIHYWYTRTSTTGISRFGTALVALYFLVDANQAMLTSVFDPKGEGLWLSRIPLSYVFLMTPPLLMLKAVLRLEFGTSKKGKGKRRDCGQQFYFARATHLERVSERIEARISRTSKFLFLVSLFAIAHLFAGPYTYFVTPKVQPPPPSPHPLHSLSDHAPTVLEHIYSLGLTLELGGTIFQFIMNATSRTYAGKYKITTFLLLVAESILFLDLLPRVVGTSARIGGVLVREGLGLTVAAVDFALAIRYKSVKIGEVEGVEE